MPQPRHEQICLEQTPFYHCVSRCVRRAFLCGHDKFTGRSYEHRRGWVEKKLLYLAQIFSIDVCAYAVMSNHTHLVLHVDINSANSWSDLEVITRWHRIFKGTILTQLYSENANLTESEISTVKETVKVYRNRLTSISWFMRVLNESIARRANKEDNCTGRFWEGRFKSQALLDEASLLACMAYVDLNPIRAHIASTPFDSHYTSIKRRIFTHKHQTKSLGLMPLKEDNTASGEKSLNYRLEDYFSLIKTSGKYLKKKLKTNVERRANLLKKHDINLDYWLIVITGFEVLFRGPVVFERKYQSTIRYNSNH